MTGPATIEIVGGGFDGLWRAAELARAGATVRFVEPELRAGSPLLTESFLTPFRFNLGPGLVRRQFVPGLRVLEPDSLLAVGDMTLGREPVQLGEVRSSVAETLSASGLGDSSVVLMTALSLLLGLDPDGVGSGAALAEAAAQLDELVLVEGGNGMAVTALVDEIVADGGQVSEGFGPTTRSEWVAGGLAVCRLFIGLRADARPSSAFATAIGFVDEESLRARLDDLRQGVAGSPFGFLLSNSHLDPHRPGDRLSSFVWQGLLPTSVTVDRGEYTSAVLDALEVPADEVIFRLLWLPEDTGEALRRL